MTKYNLPQSLPCVHGYNMLKTVYKI